MSVEQTTQLIQLILNSVLMSVACALVMGGLIARHTSIGHQIQTSGPANRPSGEPAGGDRAIAHWPDPTPYSRTALRQLHDRYKLSRYGVLAGYYALLFSVLSCLVLTLRGLLNWNGLIPVALGCFVLGIATLLLALGLTLVDWHLSDRALLAETQHLLDLGTDDSASYIKPATRRNRSNARRAKLDRRARQKMRVG